MSSNVEKASSMNLAGLLYRLAIAFPAWAGALLAVYAVIQNRRGPLKVRLK
jgi:hypothetical protein